jgi:hypothetical protein
MQEIFFARWSEKIPLDANLCLFYVTRMRTEMSNQKQVLEVVARLADAIEAIAKEAQLSDHVLTRIRNIRHDTLTMLHDRR